MKIAISTDTSCTISKALAEKLNIKVFPLNVIVNGEEFLDGISINQEKLKDDMVAGKTIKTSTPPPASIIEYFKNLFDEGYDQIIHFTISSQLSSMNQLFNFISEEEFNKKIVVIDSYAVSTLMLSHVLYAYEEINKGTSIDDILSAIEERKQNNAVVFIPENLNALKNGGRISPAIALLGNMIGLKPILTLKEGKLDKDTMARNAKKAMSERLSALLNDYPLDKFDVCITSFYGNEQLVDYLQKQVQASNPDYIAPIVPLSINVCAHTGPGTIGIVVSPKIGDKSIGEYLI
jgi:DegV family protein with EDD domain